MNVSAFEAGEQKIRAYLLNEEHPDGGPKAKALIKFGFSDLEWIILKRTLELHPFENTVEREEVTAYGRKIVIRCHLRTPCGSDPCIRTVWMTEDDQTARLVTAYPRPGSRR